MHAWNSLLLLCAVTLAWCSSARADVPRTPTGSPYAAAADEAKLVFTRPRKRLSEEVLFSIVDERGRCIGVLGNDWKVVAPLRPGTHKLLVVTGVAQPQVQILKAKLEGGKTYVVSMRPRVNARAPVEITIVRRAEQPMEAFPADILESSPFRPDLRDCTAWVASRRAKLRDKASRAKKQWNDDEAVRASQTISRSDGWTASEIDALGP